MYAREQMWHFMDVMHEDVPEECRMLETRLIRKARALPGCYNVAPGGEGIQASIFEGKVFCYMVFATAGNGIGLRQAWFRRKRALGEI